MDLTVIHDPVDRACRKSIPLGPPAASWMTHCFVGRVLKHELDVVDAGGSGVDAIGVGGGECRVDANKIPTRSSGTGRKIGNEEQFVGAGCDSGSECDRAGCR